MTTSKSPQTEPSPRTVAASAHARDRAKHRPDLEEGFFGVIWPMPAGAPVPTLARRTAAFALDLLITLPLLALAVAVTELVSGGDLLRFDALVRSALTFLLLVSVQFAFWESSPARATPGKIMLDLRVATATEKPLTFADAMIRFWLRAACIATANAGFGIAWKDGRGRAVHDRLCGTVVVAHYVTPGQLRSTSRAPRWGDFGTAMLASAVAYAFVFQAVPAVVHQVTMADRLEAAIVELTPVLASGDLLDADGRWTRPLREASATVDELELTIDVDAGEGLVLRPTAAALDQSGTVAPAVEVRLARQASAPGVVAWSCTRSGLAFYATPRHCTPMLQAVPDPELSLATGAIAG